MERLIDMDALVTQSEDTAWGAAVIAGTRVPVDTLFEYLEAGRSLDDFLEQFPTVDRELAVAILERAKHQMTAEATAG
jgi:uncharacterized protein (DUF433 family)